MKNTLANNRQIFNVKDIAYATTMENLAEGQVGIYAQGSDTSIAATVDTFAELPDNFNILSKQIKFDSVFQTFRISFSNKIKLFFIYFFMNYRIIFFKLV